MTTDSVFVAAPLGGETCGEVMHRVSVLCPAAED